MAEDKDERNQLSVTRKKKNVGLKVKIFIMTISAQGKENVSPAETVTL